MIRLRPLRPREQRNLRHWAMEFVVVVAGVLLALWAAEWAEERRDARRLADFEEALRAEMLGNYGLAMMQESVTDCYREFSAGLEAKIRAADDRWEGSGTSFTRDDLDQTGLTYGITGVLPAYHVSDVWEAAKESGLLSSMPIEKLGRYQQAYRTFEFLNSGVARVENMRDSLSGLVHPGPLAPETRTNALRDLANFNNGVQRLDQREPLDEVLGELGMTLPKAWMDRSIERSSEMRSGWGQCLRELETALPIEDNP